MLRHRFHGVYHLHFGCEGKKQESHIGLRLSPHYSYFSRFTQDDFFLSPVPELGQRRPRLCAIPDVWKLARPSGGKEREGERTNLKEGKRVRCPHFAVAEEMRYFDADAGAFQVFAVTFYYKVNH